MKIKITSNTVFYTAFFILLVFWVWFGRGYFFDEEPDVGRDAFYSDVNRQIPDQTNVAVAISGINAPIEADIFKYGRTRINDSITENGNAEESQNALQFTTLTKENSVDCSAQGAIEISSNHCTTIENIEALVRQNHILLNRYYSLYKITDWQSPVNGGGQTILDLNHLISAHIKLLISKKEPEKAYQLWKNNHMFISQILGQETTIITMAIFLVADGLSLSSLENLLYTYPGVGLNHSKELESLFIHNNLERYNLKGKLRAEYQFFNSHLFNKADITENTHPEYMRNRIYRSHLKFLSNTELPPEKMLSSVEKNTTNSYTAFAKALLPHGLSNVLVNILIESFNTNTHLVLSMHAKNASIKLLDLNLSIQQQHISKENIQAFLDESEKKYECPFTQKPMAWDAEKETIYCENPKEKQKAAEVRLRL